MGIGLWESALLVARDVGLPHASARVYAYAAHCALDRDARPVYFGGRDRLALALGKRSTVAGYRAVEDAVSTLKRHGLLKVVVRGAPNRNARYALLDGAGEPLKPADNTHGSPVGVHTESDDNTHGSADRHPRLSRQTPTAQVGAEGHKGHDGQGGARYAHTHPAEDHPRQTARAAGAAGHIPERVTRNTAETAVTAGQVSQAPHAPSSITTGAGGEPVGDPLVCPRHPDGNPNDYPCRGCGKVREARERLEAEERKRRESPRFLQTVQPGSRCADGRHKFAADRTCINCYIRASDPDHPDYMPSE